MNIKPRPEKGYNFNPITKEIDLNFSLTPSNDEIVITYDNKVIASLSVSLATSADEKIAAGFFLEFNGCAPLLDKNIVEVEAGLYGEEN